MLSAGALAEITYALDELKADGIALPSSFGEGANASMFLTLSIILNADKCFIEAYIGDDQYDPIWEELNRRQTVVFLHGTQTPSSTPYPHPFLGLPITEVCLPLFPSPSHFASLPSLPTGSKRNLQSSIPPCRNRPQTQISLRQDHPGAFGGEHTFPRAARRGPLQTYGVYTQQ